MTKQEAIEMFGTGAALARALGITRGAISLWPSVLYQARIDRVRGAAMRLGKSLPGDQTKRQEEGAHA